MKPKAFIFDLDGVLTDTANLHYIAWKELADELGMKFDSIHNEYLKGVSRIRSFEIILEINDALEEFSIEQRETYANKKNERYVELIGTITPADVLPNIMNFLNQAREAGIKLAVASASRNAAQVIKSLQIEQLFDFIADAGQIKNSKPDPEVFLVCCEQLGFAPKQCIGFEDAQAGIESISAAEMFSVGINVDVTTLPPNLALKSTSELNMSQIISAYSSYIQSSQQV